jgi:hypothetical protein
MYANTSGNVVLDDQGFIFNSLNLTGTGFTGLTNLDTYLVSVQVKEVGSGDTGAFLGLSAITVDSPVPEPSTVALVLVGLGAVGFGALRRKKA